MNLEQLPENKALKVSVLTGKTAKSRLCKYDYKIPDDPLFVAILKRRRENSFFTAVYCFIGGTSDPHMLTEFEYTSEEDREACLPMVRLFAEIAADLFDSAISNPSMNR
jgi:hypothetical protein